MAKFYVGQRVRIKWSKGWPDLAGQEGTVIEQSLTGGVNGKSDWIVAPDCWGSPNAPCVGVHGSWVFGPHSSQLEPIVPPHEACDDAEFIASLDKLAQRVGEVA